MPFPVLLINIVISSKVFCQYSNTLLKGFVVLYSKITLKPRFSHVWISRITLIFRFIIKQYIRLSYILFDARWNTLPIKLACTYLCDYVTFSPPFNFFFPELRSGDLQNFFGFAQFKWGRALSTLVSLRFECVYIYNLIFYTYLIYTFYITIF